MTAQTVTYRCPHCQQPVDVDLQPENEMLVCPNEGCGKPFKVDIPRAEPLEGLIVPNGTTERLPEATAVPAAVAAPVALPPDALPEEAVQTIRLSMVRRYPFRCLGYAILTLSFFTAAVLFLVRDHPYFALACFAAGGIVFYRLAVWWMRMNNTVLQITNRRCVVESGVFNKQSTEIPLDDIADIEVQQTFVQRMFNVGDLNMTSKSKEGKRVVVMAVPSPRDVACTIRDKRPKRDASSTRFGTDS